MLRPEIELNKFTLCFGEKEKKTLSILLLSSICHPLGLLYHVPLKRFMYIFSYYCRLEGGVWHVNIFFYFLLRVLIVLHFCCTYNTFFWWIVKIILLLSLLPCRQWSNSDLNVGPSISSCISHMLFLHSFVSHYGEEDSKLSPTSCYFCKPEVKSKGNLL